MNESIPIRISRVHFPVTTLGPGQRVGIWFQGCSIRCAGCISTDTWEKERGLTTVGDLLALVHPWMQVADGVTVSGGEPFDQVGALTALLCGLKRAQGQDVLVYSGYPFERISAYDVVASGQIDAVISDPFEIDSPQTLALRGSDNQRLNLITDTGRKRFSSYQTTVEISKRSLDAMFDQDGAVWFAGIPNRGDFARLRAVLREQGHEVLTSEAEAKS